jgi:amyloid beta precursor protein binding protein 1
VEPDIGRLKNCVSKVLADCYSGLSATIIKDDLVHEVCRYGGAEPHALAAFIGGCAAQEAIKLLTKQYVPVDNLFLFNAMTMNTLSLKVA